MYNRSRERRRETTEKSVHKLIFLHKKRTRNCCLGSCGGGFSKRELKLTDKSDRLGTVRKENGESLFQKYLFVSEKGSVVSPSTFSFSDTLRKEVVQPGSMLIECTAFLLGS